jgi:heptosyltransferase-2
MSKNFHHIIIRMPNWIGDAVMATPLIKDLRRHFPQAEIALMCQGAIGQLFQKDPQIDEILSFQKSNGWLRGQHSNIICPLRYGGYDLGILTTNSLSSAWWFWRGEVQNKIGFSKGLRRLFLDMPLPFPQDKETIHQVDLYKKLLTPLGILPSETKMYLHVTEEETTETKTFLRNYGVNVGEEKIIGINPGAAYGSAKCWLPERFRKLAEMLREHLGAKVIFLGDGSQKALVNTIVSGLDKGVVNLAGKTTLRQLMALINSIDLLVANDSGPMHMASALGKPLVALFGSTNYIRSGPYNGGTVLYKAVPCSPCHKRVCPIDFPCMKGISVEDVYTACIKELESRGKNV